MNTNVKKSQMCASMRLYSVKENIEDDANLFHNPPPPLNTTNIR